MHEFAPAPGVFAQLQRKSANRDARPRTPTPASAYRRPIEIGPPAVSGDDRAQIADGAVGGQAERRHAANAAPTWACTVGSRPVPGVPSRSELPVVRATADCDR